MMLHGLAYRVLKKTVEEVHVSPILAKIFYFSLQAKVFPTIWKNANATPLFKNKGKKSDLKIYRPVSLLSCIGKILERVIHDVTFKYLLDVQDVWDAWKISQMDQYVPIRSAAEGVN